MAAAGVLLPRWASGQGEQGAPLGTEPGVPQSLILQVLAAWSVGPAVLSFSSAPPIPSPASRDPHRWFVPAQGALTRVSDSGEVTLTWSLSFKGVERVHKGAQHSHCGIQGLPSPPDTP